MLCEVEREANKACTRAFNSVDHALEAIIDEHYGRIQRAALLLVGNQHDAEELTQETFLQAMLSWRRFAGRSRVDTWLYSILVKQHHKQQRAQRRRRARWLRWFQRSLTRQHLISPEDALRQEEWKTSLWTAVAELSTAQRTTIVLRYSEGMTQEEIAKVMRCPVGTVKSRLHHGLAVLTRQLEECSPNVMAKQHDRRKSVRIAPNPAHEPEGNHES